MSTFHQGDIVQRGNQTFEVAYWPEDDNGFAVLAEHHESKSSNLSYDNAASAKDKLVLIRRADETASVLPAPVSEGDAAAIISSAPPATVSVKDAAPVSSPPQAENTPEIPADEQGTAAAE